MTSKTNAKTILLAAGGTGGHLFPAEALAHELIGRGYLIVLATDKRADQYAGAFPAVEKHLIGSATISGKNPIALIKAGFAMFDGYRQSRALVQKIKPLAAIGFGGYPTLPPMLAALRLGVPCLVHEQNAILGRANKVLAKRVTGIATGFDLVGFKPDRPVVLTGNPLRSPVHMAARKPYPKRKPTDMFRLLVFGGSQGAHVFSQILPAALALLEADLKKRIRLVHQVRQEDLGKASAEYKALGIKAETAPFFTDMPARIAAAHLVIARAGASSVGELAAIGRPSILVPMPSSLDGDQAANAAAMQTAGGAFVVRQSEFTAQKLAQMLSEFISRPEQGKQMATRAKSTAKPEAASHLANCVECIIAGRDLTKLT